MLYAYSTALSGIMTHITDAAKHCTNESLLYLTYITTTTTTTTITTTTTTTTTPTTTTNRYQYVHHMHASSGTSTESNLHQVGTNVLSYSKTTTSLDAAIIVC
jgi:hypothetical protein